MTEVTGTRDWQGQHSVVVPQLLRPSLHLKQRVTPAQDLPQRIRALPGHCQRQFLTAFGATFYT